MGKLDAEKLYSWLAGATPITFFVFDLQEQKTLYTNRRLVESLGYTAEQLQALGNVNPLDFVHPDDRDSYIDSIRRQRESADNEVASGLFRFRKPDQSYIWLSSFTSPLARDENGKVREVFGVAILVTEQKEAELALARSQANLRALCENTGDAIFSVDRQQRLLAYNAAFARLFRRSYSVDAKVGLDVTGVLGEKQKAIWLARSERALSGERFAVCERVRMGDAHFDLETSFNPIVSAEGNVEGVAVFSRDITERKQMETALLEAESRLRILADRAQDVVAVYRVKPHPRQEYISPSVENLVGYPPEAFYDDPHMHEKIIHPDDREVLAELRTLPKSYDQTVTFRWIHKQGHAVWVELTRVPIYDASGELSAVESIARDVTAKVQLEEQLRQSQKIEAVGRLAGGIAHDFNNLLGVVMGNIELARRNLGESSAAREYLDSIEDAAQRGITLTRQLLSFSRPQVAKPQLLDLNDTISNIQSMLSRLLRERISVSLSLGQELPLVRCDPGQLEQLLLNLAVNARDAMPDGGEIEIRTRAADRAHDLLKGRVWGRPPTGAVVALSVCDRGVGMDAATLTKAFEEFFTTKSRGTGLGLSIVRRIAESNGGAIGVESELGTGTTFTVVFPLAVDAPASARVPRGQTSPAVGRTVLLVESEPPLRRLARVILGAEGYRVVESSSPEEALELSEKCDRIDLLLTGVAMPKMSGEELASALLPNWPRLEVLYMSGSDESPAEDASRVIKKPFSASELLERVATVLDRETRSASLG
jgi:PAS domain S-box-containing protein